MRAVLTALALRKRYGDRFELDVGEIELLEGELLVFLGPSGSGKTTALRLLHLLERPDSGKIFFGGREVQDLKGGEKTAVIRRMAMGFQDPVFFTTDVYSNVAMGLRFRKLPEREVSLRVKKALDLVGMGAFAEADVRTLSGGESQKVAIARALATGPEVLFLDEPFSSLDPESRRECREIVRSLVRQEGISTIFVTHDFSEASFLGDRIAVMNCGKIVQTGTFEEITFEPESVFVARFTGMENIYSGRVLESSGGILRISLEGKAVEAVGEVAAGETVCFGIRPEDITLMPADVPGAVTSQRNSFPGEVVKVEKRGPTARVSVRCPFLVTAAITGRSLEDLGIEPGSSVGVSFKATSVWICGGEDGERGN